MDLLAQVLKLITAVIGLGTTIAKFMIMTPSSTRKKETARVNRR